MDGDILVCPIFDLVMLKLLRYCEIVLIKFGEFIVVSHGSLVYPLLVCDALETHMRVQILLIRFTISEGVLWV